MSDKISLVNPALPVQNTKKSNLPVILAEDVELMQDTTAALLQDIPSQSSYILYGFLGFVACFLIWAYAAEIEEVTVGEGKVTPSSQVQVIQNLEGGIVSEIPVKEGSVVHKVDVVLRIDSTRFASTYGETNAKQEALSSRIARQIAESTGKPFMPPAALIKNNPKLVAEEQSLYLSRQQDLTTSIYVLKQQASQRSQELLESKAKLNQMEESYRLVDKELSMSRKLAASGDMSEVEILRLERQLSDLKGEIDTTRLSLPRLQQATQEARARADATTAKFRSEAASDANIAYAELAGANAASLADKDRLDRTIVRSPMNGVIKQIKVTTIGGILQPGMDVMEIVPIEDKLEIETKVRPSDIAFVHPGQRATVKLTAYDFSIYGALDARVSNISADTITVDKLGKSESYYLVRVRILTKGLGIKKSLPIMPGMMATVHIITGKKTILDYLLKPVLKAKSEAFRER